MNRATRKHGEMKGQFFLIGAFLLIMMFYVGISLYFSPSHSVQGGHQISDLSENILAEYPRAFNFGMNSSSPSQVLANFTGLAVNLTGQRNAELKVLWIITQNVSDDLNVTAGNFLGYPAEITLNVSGEVKNLYVGSGAVNSTLFASPPSEFELRANFNTTEKNLLLEKFKANLWVLLEISDGGNKAAGEIKA